MGAGSKVDERKVRVSVRKRVGEEVLMQPSSFILRKTLSFLYISALILRAEYHYGAKAQCMLNEDAKKSNTARKALKSPVPVNRGTLLIICWNKAWI